MCATDQAATEKPTRSKTKELEVIVADVIKETPDTVTLLLFTGNEELCYRPGHFLTIDPHQFPALDRFTRFLEDTKGRREPARAYSMASAPHEKHLAITVKEEPYVSGKTPYPPLLSPLLVRQTPVGTPMVVTGFAGPFTLPQDIGEKTDHMVHVAAGSGVVPNFSMIKYALDNIPDLRHTLICSNKTWDDVIYKWPLKHLQNTHPGKLKVIHSLTREDAAFPYDDTVRAGRISRDLLWKAIDDPMAAEYFICGPGITPHDRKAAKENHTVAAPRFMETVLGLLEELDVDPKKIHKESYG